MDKNYLRLECLKLVQSNDMQGMLDKAETLFNWIVEQEPEPQKKPRGRPPKLRLDLDKGGG